MNLERLPVEGEEGVKVLRAEMAARELDLGAEFRETNAERLARAFAWMTELARKN